MTEHGRLFDDVAEAYDRFRPSPDLIEAPGLLPSPPSDRPVVAGEQDLGNAMAAKDGRPGVARCAQAAAEKGIPPRAVEVGHRPREKTHGGVDDRKRCYFAATQDEVADGDLLRSQVIRNALIDVLVVTA